MGCGSGSPVVRMREKRLRPRRRGTALGPPKDPSIEGSIAVTRNLKALGLALAAVCMFAALSAASSAQASTFTEFETPEGREGPEVHAHSILEATTDPETVESYASGFGTIECHVTYEATSLTGEDSELTVKATNLRNPKDTESPDCRETTSVGTFTVHMEFGNCDYIFKAGAQVVGNADAHEGTVSVHCPEPADEIDIKITKANENKETKCTLKVPGSAQGKNQNLGGLTYTNNTNPEPEPTDLTLHLSLEGLVYTSEGGLLNCGVANGEHTFTYTATDTVRAFNTEEAQIDAEVSGA